MSAERLVERLRRMLLALTALAFVVTPIELWLTEHTQEAPQFIPFILCGLGLAALLAAWLRPSRASVLALRGTMALVALGGALGTVLHGVNNFAFELEIRPNSTFTEVWLEALRGANPLLAPGILGLAAALAVLATLYHPALQSSSAP